jgi:hypothetical protein
MRIFPHRGLESGADALFSNKKGVRIQEAANLGGETKSDLLNAGWSSEYAEAVLRAVGVVVFRERGSS